MNGWILFQKKLAIKCRYLLEWLRSSHLVTAVYSSGGAAAVLLMDCCAMCGAGCRKVAAVVLSHFISVVAKLMRNIKPYENDPMKVQHAGKILGRCVK